MIKFLNILKEIKVLNPSQITYVDSKDIYEWEYLGGSDGLDELLNVNSKLDGVLIFNKYIYTLNPPLSHQHTESNIINNYKEEGKEYFILLAKYFKKGRPSSSLNILNKLDIPITLNNIIIIQ